MEVLVVDTHCHVHESWKWCEDKEEEEKEEETEEEQHVKHEPAALSKTVAAAFLMSTQPCQWQQVLQLAKHAVGATAHIRGTCVHVCLCGWWVWMGERKPQEEHITQTSLTCIHFLTRIHCLQDLIGAEIKVAGRHDTISHALPSLVACVGIHPWFAHHWSQAAESPGASHAQAPYKWEQDLDAILTQHPHVQVGEIGLDFVAKTKETGTTERVAQEDVFQRCFALAARHQRAVSLHCVKAYEPLVSFLQSWVRGLHVSRKAELHRSADDQAKKQKEGASNSTASKSSSSPSRSLQMPPAITLHSYCGSKDTALRILRLLGEPTREEPPCPHAHTGDSDGGNSDARVASMSAGSIAAEWLLGRCRLHKLHRHMNPSGDAAPLLPRAAFVQESEPAGARSQLPQTTRVFFGISQAVSLRSAKKAHANLAAIPLRNLLLESDRCSIAKVDEDLARVLDLIADVKQLPRSEVSRVLNENAISWLLAGCRP